MSGILFFIFASCHPLNYRTGNCILHSSLWSNEICITCMICKEKLVINWNFGNTLISKILVDYNFVIKSCAYYVCNILFTSTISCHKNSLLDSLNIPLIMNHFMCFCRCIHFKLCDILITFIAKPSTKHDKSQDLFQFSPTTCCCCLLHHALCSVTYSHHISYSSWECINKSVSIIFLSSKLFTIWNLW